MSERLFDEAFLRQLERLALVARRAVAGTTQGERRSRKLGQSVEFTDYRPYVAGDDFRRIDWNAYARLERFFLKLFIEEEDLTIHFLLDNSASMDWGTPTKLAYAARAAGALGYIALSGLDRVTVTAVGGENGRTARTHLPPLRGKRQAITLFSFLQEVSHREGQEVNNPRPAVDIARQMRAYAGTAGSPGMVVLLSDLMDDGWLKGLRALFNRGFEITVLHVLAPDEVDPEMNGDFRLLDSEGAGSVEITADYEMLQRYRAHLAEWQDGLRKFCAGRRMHYLPVETTTPLEVLLFAWMRRQGVLV